jgi:hypothetical protein
LQQVAAGLELYFHKHHGYPPAGSDLGVDLAPYVTAPEVFENPLREEPRPGHDLTALYQHRTLEEVDRVGSYVACFPPDDPTDPIVVLETGNRITRRRNPGFHPHRDQLSTLLALLYPDAEVSGQPSDEIPPAGDPPGEPPEPSDGGGTPDDYCPESPEGVVVPKDCCEVTFEVRSVRLTWGPNGADVPITVSLGLRDTGGSWGQPRALFGGQPVAGGERETVTVRQGQAYTLTFHAAYGTWAVTCTSDGDPDQVLTLRNGDTPAPFDPYGSPCPAGAAVQGLLDPATGAVTLANDRVLYLVELDGSSAAPGGSLDYQDLILLATLQPPSDPAECIEPILPGDGFDIAADGEVTPRTCSDVTILCVGSQFGYADGTLVPTKAAAKLGSEPWLDLFGGRSVRGGEQSRLTSVPPGTPLVLKGEIVGSYERWLWTRYGYPLSYTSNDGTGQVLVYRRGDQAPDFVPGLTCQVSAEDLIASYIDPQTGLVTIADNQVLFLWDFNPRRTHRGIDYQDLILLATAEAAAQE